MSRGMISDDFDRRGIFALKPGETYTTYPADDESVDFERVGDHYKVSYTTIMGNRFSVGIYTADKINDAIKELESYT